MFRIFGFKQERTKPEGRVSTSSPASPTNCSNIHSDRGGQKHSGHHSGKVSSDQTNQNSASQVKIKKVRQQRQSHPSPTGSPVIRQEPMRTVSFSHIVQHQAGKSTSSADQESSIPPARLHHMISLSPTVSSEFKGLMETLGREYLDYVWKEARTVLRNRLPRLLSDLQIMLRELKLDIGQYEHLTRLDDVARNGNEEKLDSQDSSLSRKRPLHRDQISEGSESSLNEGNGYYRGGDQARQSKKRAIGDLFIVSAVSQQGQAIQESEKTHSGSSCSLIDSEQLRSSSSQPLVSRAYPQAQAGPTRLVSPKREEDTKDLFAQTHVVIDIAPRPRTTTRSVGPSTRIGNGNSGCLVPTSGSTSPIAPDSALQSSKAQNQTRAKIRDLPHPPMQKLSPQSLDLSFLDEHVEHWTFRLQQNIHSALSIGLCLKTFLDVHGPNSVSQSLISSIRTQNSIPTSAAAIAQADARLQKTISVLAVNGNDTLDILQNYYFKRTNLLIQPGVKSDPQIPSKVHDSQRKILDAHTPPTPVMTTFSDFPLLSNEVKQHPIAQERPLETNNHALLALDYQQQQLRIQADRQLYQLWFGAQELQASCNRLLQHIASSTLGQV